MSVKTMGLVWDLEPSVIDHEEKFILLAYADHADHNGENMYPSVALICRKTGYSERSVQGITRSLIDKGFLVEDGRGPHGTNKFHYGGVQKLRGADSAGVQNIVQRGADSAPELKPLTIIKEPLPEPKYVPIQETKPEVKPAKPAPPKLANVLGIDDWPADVAAKAVEFSRHLFRVIISEGKVPQIATSLKGYWIKTLREEWVNVTIEEIGIAYDWCIANKTSIKSPASLSYAFNDIREKRRKPIVSVTVEAPVIGARNI